MKDDNQYIDALSRIVHEDKNTVNHEIGCNFPEEYREDSPTDIANMLKIMFGGDYALGTVVTPSMHYRMVVDIAKELHERHVIELKNAGYHFGMKQNDDVSKGELTHPDMLPWEEYRELFPDKVAHYCDCVADFLRLIMKKYEGMVFIKMFKS